MGIKNKLSKQSFYIGIIFISIAATLGIYYYSYIQGREDYLSKRNLRLLSRLGNQINSIIDGAGEIRKNEIDTFQYLCDSSTVHDSLIPKIQNLMSLDTLLDGVNIIKPRRNTDSTQINKTGNKNTARRHIRPQLSFSVNRGEIAIIYNSFVQGRIVTFSLASRLDNYIEDINREEIFDDVFMVNSDSGIVVQDSRTPLRIVRIDSLKGPRGKTHKFEAFSKSDAVGWINIAGQEYQLFIHPLPPADTKSRVFGSRVANNWVICGVVSSDKFRRESMEISKNVLIIFLIIIPLFVFIWPLLKLKFAVRSTRLKIHDTIFTILASIFATAFLTITFLDVLTSINFVSEANNQLKGLTNEVSNNFKQEIKKVILQLKKLDSDKSMFNTKNLMSGNLIDTILSNEDSIIYPYFEQVFWCDSNGIEIVKRAVKNYTPKQYSVSDRDYFLNVINNKTWFNKSKEFTTDFYLEPLRSKSTGDFSTSLAIHSTYNKKLPVAVMDFKPVSLVGVIIPKGFKFAIIDDEGKVLFHSIPDRNLQENLYDELENSARQRLRAIINARTDDYFVSDYWGKSNRFYVKPMEGMPWFVVSFLENDYLQSTNLEIVSVSSILFFLYIIPFILAFLYFLLVPSDRAAWVWPQYRKPEIYKRLILCFAFLSAALLIILILTNEEITLFGAFFLPHLGVILTYLAFNDSYKSEYFRKKSSRKTFGRKFLSKPALLLSADFLLLFLVYILFRQSLSADSLYFIAGILICFIACYLILFSNRVIKEWAGKIKFPIIEKPPSLYTTTIIFLFALGIILPSVSFFKLGYTTQLKLFIRNEQLEYAHDYENKLLTLKKQYNPDIFPKMNDSLKDKTNKELLALSVCDSFFYYTRLDSTIRGYSAKPLEWFETSVIKKFMPSFNQLAVNEKSISSEPVDTSVYCFNETDNQRILMTQKKTFEGIKNPVSERTLYISSVFPSMKTIFTSRSLAQILLIIIIICLLISLFVWMVHFIIDKIFWLSLKKSEPPQCALDKDTPIHSHIILFSIDGKWFDNINSKNQKKYNLSNEIEKKEFQIPDEEIIIFENMQDNYFDAEKNKTKLFLLERLVHSTAKKIVIVSSMDPLANFALGEDQERWKQLLNQFERKWKYLDAVNPDDTEHPWPVQINAIQTEDRENKIEHTRAHFNFLWLTCSLQERYILSRLVDDEHISPANKKIVTALMDRGIVVLQPNLKICCPELDKFFDEVKSAKDEALWSLKEDESFWGKVKVPVLFALILLAVFLFGTQRDLFNNTLTFVTATAALIPALFKLLGAFQLNKLTK